MYFRDLQIQNNVFVIEIYDFFNKILSSLGLVYCLIIMS